MSSRVPGRGSLSVKAEWGTAGHPVSPAATWDLLSEPLGDDACAQMGLNRGVPSTVTGLEHRLSPVPSEL